MKVLEEEMEGRIFALLMGQIHHLGTIANHLGVSDSLALTFMNALEDEGKVWRSEGHRSRWFASSAWIIERVFRDINYLHLDWELKSRI